MATKKTKFKLRAGQIDYTNARWAPVINCVLKHKDKILIVRRALNLKFYPGYWNGISGFLDDERILDAKVRDELREETGILAKNIISIRVGEIFDQEESVYKKTWIVHPILVKVATNKIKLDWEAKTYRWIRVNEAKKFKLLPGFDRVLKNLGVGFKKQNS